jgi:hypothetical protein
VAQSNHWRPSSTDVKNIRMGAGPNFVRICVTSDKQRCLHLFRKRNTKWFKHVWDGFKWLRIFFGRGGVGKLGLLLFIKSGEFIVYQVGNTDIIKSSTPLICSLNCGKFRSWVLIVEYVSGVHFLGLYKISEQKK